MHGHTNWMYVIDVVPQTQLVLQNMEELASIDEINRTLHDTDESSEEEGSSTQEEISYYNSSSQVVIFYLLLFLMTTIV